MAGLGQVNLLVGKNNTGKSSVLEALYLLKTGGDPSALWRVMTRRGEQLPPEVRVPQGELDLCHVFHGHEIKPDSTISIATSNQSPEQAIQFKAIPARREDNPTLFAQMPAEFERTTSARLAISITGSPNPLVPLVPLSPRYGLRPEMFQTLNNMAVNAPRIDATSPQLVTTESWSMPELMQGWNTISLTPYDKRVVSALKHLDPTINAIAVSLLPQFYGGYQRGGFKIGKDGKEQPELIGSMGEGTWRMFAIAVALSRAKDNLLLIDEIDTGFHHTVMAEMWRFLFATAKDLNVQVFATTHSHDCVHALSVICRADVMSGSEVTIQRIETGKSKAVAYTEAEIKAIAENNIEAV